MVFTYPAIFDPDEQNRGYTVTFPDLPGCITEGDTLQEALTNAEEAMALYLEPDYDDDSPSFPKASDIASIFTNKPAFATLVKANVNVDTRKSVRKNLTLPAWLNTRAEAAGVNFSQTLQEALKEKLAL